GHVALLHGRLEGRQVDLAQRPLVDDLVDRLAVGLLVVRGEVLDLGEYPLLLDRLHLGDGQSAGQVRILAEVLEVAPVAGYPGDVHAGRLDEVLAAVGDLLAGDRPEAGGRRGVPGRGHRERGWQRGGRLRAGAVARPGTGRP